MTASVSVLEQARAALASDDVLSLSRLAAAANFASVAAERDINGRTLLHQAVASGSTDSALFLLDNRLADANVADGQGETPLMRAAWLGNAPVISALAEAGARLDTQALSGGTALHHAYAGSTAAQPVVDQLVALGANPSALDRSGQSPSDWASQAVSREAGQDLLTRAAKPPKRDTLRLSR